jgi:hypothetical protein
MITREVVATYAPARPRDLVLKTPANWTAVIFFAVLSGLHFSIALPAFYRGHWEGYLSLIFGCTFLAVSVIAYFARYEMTILPRERRIRVRNGVGPLRFQRSIPFDDVHAVRLTFCTGRRGRCTESCIEVLCDNEDLECPPTTIPRQEALFLAITLGVQLIKVTNDTDALPERSSDRQL